MGNQQTQRLSRATSQERFTVGHSVWCSSVSEEGKQYGAYLMVQIITFILNALI